MSRAKARAVMSTRKAKESDDERLEKETFWGIGKINNRQQFLLAVLMSTRPVVIVTGASKFIYTRCIA